VLTAVLYRWCCSRLWWCGWGRLGCCVRHLVWGGLSSTGSQQWRDAWPWYRGPQGQTQGWHCV